MRVRRFRCYECGNTWEVACGLPRPEKCPRCKSRNLHRAEEDRGYNRRGGKRGWCGFPKR